MIKKYSQLYIYIEMGKFVFIYIWFQT